MMFKRLNKLDYVILGVLLVIALATSGASFAFSVADEGIRGEWWEGWFQNFSTEMFGAFLGFWLLGIIVDKRRRQEAKQEDREEQKQKLIRQIRSRILTVAVNAIESLRGEGWLLDGSLRGENFAAIILPGAPLSGANLESVNLVTSDLNQADFTDANLRGAILQLTNLQEVIFRGANLQEVNFQLANLQGADLRGTNMQGANLKDADLQNARIEIQNSLDAEIADADGARLLMYSKPIDGLRSTQFDETTILPDGQPWTPGTDITRFTDPNHPEFFLQPNTWFQTFQSMIDKIKTDDK